MNKEISFDKEWFIFELKEIFELLPLKLFRETDGFIKSIYNEKLIILMKIILILFLPITLLIIFFKNLRWRN